ncbi:hypothetical protein [Insolitispirillum peregrinum]|uniref:hypothetical protein n=1 Tax=Insolitispirillum peregrinum TaxID=80876 RepID=UPI003607A7FD
MREILRKLYGEYVYRDLSTVIKKVNRLFPTMEDRANTYPQQMLKVYRNQDLYRKKRGRHYVDGYVFLYRKLPEKHRQYIEMSADQVTGAMDDAIGLNLDAIILSSLGCQLDRVVCKMPMYGDITVGSILSSIQKGPLSLLYAKDSKVMMRPVNAWSLTFTGKVYARGAPSAGGKLVDNLMITANMRTPRHFAFWLVRLLAFLMVYELWRRRAQGQSPETDDKILSEGTGPKSSEDAPAEMSPHQVVEHAQNGNTEQLGGLQGQGATLSPQQRGLFASRLGLNGYNPGVLGSWTLPLELHFRQAFYHAAEVTCDRCGTIYVWPEHRVNEVTFIDDDTGDRVFPCPRCMSLDPLRTIREPPTCTIRPIMLTRLRAMLLGIV